MTVLFYLSIILFAGVFLSKVVSYVKLPDVTGYLIAGLLIGPSLFHFIPEEVAAGLNVVSETALAFIAFSIGSQFDINQLKKVGSGIWLITVCEAMGAVILVDLAMIFLFRQPVPFSLVLGAIAAATAPAATLMVVKQYRAKGPLVDTLLPVVAADDAVGIIAFGISTAVAKSLTGASRGITVTDVLLKPAGEILGALGIGVVLGLFFTFVSSRSKGQGALLAITVATVLLGQGIASRFGLSSLLLCMTVGMVMTNLSKYPSRILSNVEAFTPPVYVAFFTLAGVNMDIGILMKIILQTKLLRPGTDITETSLCRFLHNISKLSGQDKLPGAGHGKDLNGQGFSADGSPCKSGYDSYFILTRNFIVMKPGNTEILMKIAFGNTDTCGF